MNAIQRLSCLSAAAMLASVGMADAQQVFKATGGLDAAPFHWIDPATNAHRGIMVDLLDAIAADAGFQIEYVEAMPTTELLPALSAGAIQIVSHNIAITPERQEQFGFSAPFVSGGDGLLTLKSDTTDYRTFEDLKGAVVGASRGTVFQTALENNAAILGGVRLYESNALLAQAIASAEIKAGLVAGVSLEYQLAEGEYPELKLAPSWQMVQPTRAGIAVRKSDTELLQKIDTWLAKVMADGTVRDIFAKYGINWRPPS